jgi:hypothetical protein
MDQLPYELDQPTLRNWTLLVLELSAQIIPIKVFFFEWHSNKSLIMYFGFSQSTRAFGFWTSERLEEKNHK